ASCTIVPIRMIASRSSFKCESNSCLIIVIPPYPNHLSQLSESPYQMIRTTLASYPNSSCQTIRTTLASYPNSSYQTIRTTLASYPNSSYQTIRTTLASYPNSSCQTIRITLSNDPNTPLSKPSTNIIFSPLVRRVGENISRQIIFH